MSLPTAATSTARRSWPARKPASRSHVPKPMTSNSKAEGRFGKQDFRYVAEEDVYVCPAGERLAYSYTTEDKGLVVHRYATKACRYCTIKQYCTKGNAATDLPMGA